MGTFTGVGLKQRRREAARVEKEYEMKQRSIKSSKSKFHVTVVNDKGFMFVEIVGAETGEDAVKKVKKMAWRSWGMGSVKMENIECTNVEMV